jgi:DNA-3-methyladenine glycosylase II
MEIHIPTTKPFSFRQSLTFACRFAPLQTAAIIDADRMVAAFAADGRGWACELRERPTVADELVVTLPPGAPEHLATRMSDLVGARDDLRPFYALAAADPAMAPVVTALHGLHQVRFLGLEEIAVYCVMMQRTPIRIAASYKSRFLERFGLPAELEGRTLRAMPSIDALAELDIDDIADAIHHRPKAERIAGVVRAVAKLGEDFLTTAPYAEARDALLEIPGIGPFSAVAILLRGLGRAEEVPSLEMFEDAGREIYGRRWNTETIAAHYGTQIGTWAFYLKTAASRMVASAA